MENGTIIHSRNLDFSEPEFMRPIVYRAQFTHNGTLSFEAIMFAGTVGIYTGMKPGIFSVSENQRFPNKNIWGLF